MQAQLLSHVQFLATPWTVARPTPLIVGFSRQAYYSELPFPPPRDPPDPGIEPMSPAPPPWAGRFFTTEPPGKPSHSSGCQQSKSRWFLNTLLLVELRNTNTSRAEEVVLEAGVPSGSGVGKTEPIGGISLNCLSFPRPKTQELTRSSW